MLFLSSIRSFRGGIHPLHEIGGGKAATRGLAIERAPAPARVCLPMSQHIGGPCVPCVQVGQRVLRGQVIGRPRGFVSAPVHASVSGTVVAVGPHAAIGNANATCVVIENDGRDEWDPACAPADVSALTPQEILSRIGEAGIVGMGGAAFPSRVKLSPPGEKKIDFLLLNGAECEPYLSADHRMMLEEGEKILRGASFVAKALGGPQVIVGVEANKRDAAEVLTSLVSPYGFRVQVLRVKYPQGSEKQLISALTGRKVPSGGLPMDAGCVVVNVSTAAAIADAVELGLPLTERVLTVTGAVKTPKNLRVRIGTPVQELIDYCGGLNADAARVVSGGPMMGIALFSLDVPVVKGTSGILALTKAQTETGEATACIRCGRCVRICPIHLLPYELCNDFERGDFAAADKHNALDCIECGSCTYVCPAKRNITSAIRVCKRQVQALHRKS